MYNIISVNAKTTDFKPINENIKDIYARYLYFYVRFLHCYGEQWTYAVFYSQLNLCFMSLHNIIRWSLVITIPCALVPDSYFLFDYLTSKTASLLYLQSSSQVNLIWINCGFI